MKFSVTIPAYKAKYLKDCIDSVLSQTFQDYEIVIVDDASPEDLASIVNQFDDQRIRYYRNEKNFGALDVVDNWNKCLEYAKGEWIICMGDDDKLLPECLEEYDKLIKKYPYVQVLHGWTEIIDENSNFAGLTASRIEYESCYSLIWHRWNGRERQFIGDFLFNREKLLAMGGFYKLPFAWASDDITAVLMAEPAGIANTPRIVFQYRDSGMTITSTGNIKVKVDAIKQEIEWYRLFLSKKSGNEVDEKFRHSIVNEFNRHFQKKYAYYLIQDIRSNRIRFFYWLTHRRNYDMSISLIIYSFIMSFK